MSFAKRAEPCPNLGEVVQAYFQMIEPLFSELGLEPEAFSDGLEELQEGLNLLGGEARRARRRGISFVDAVRSDEFPYLQKTHNFLRDILTLRCPPELLGLLRRLLAMPEPPAWKVIIHTLARIANGGNPAEQASACFFVFQLGRLNLLLRTWNKAETLVSVGIEERRLEEVAEQEMREWVAQIDSISPEVHFERVLAASCMVNLNLLHGSMLDIVRQLTKDTFSEFRLRGKLEHQLRQMHTDEAILIKNVMDNKIWGEPKLGPRRLQEQHPFVFEGLSHDAIYQRTSRLVRKVKNLESVEDWPIREGQTTFVDFLHPANQKEASNELHKQPSQLESDTQQSRTGTQGDDIPDTKKLD